MVNQSKNKFTMKTKYGAAIAPVFILAGAYVAWSYIGRRMGKKKEDDTNDNRNSKNGALEGNGAKVKNLGKEGLSGGIRSKGARKTLSKSVSLGAIHGGKIALQRLLDFHSYRPNASSLENTEDEFDTLLSKEHPDFVSLQRAVLKMEVSGKEAKGVEMLKKALEKATKEGNVHEAYEIEMLLVEMLIYTGNIQKASKCKCLGDELITDARSPLYKAIIQFLQGDPEEQVLNSFNKFREIQSSFRMTDERPEDRPEDDEIHRKALTFEEFKSIMESLKQEVQEGSKKNSTSKS
ncbi:PREDICTED: uncharacterized protein LOC104814297 [Tarenaya hassleriana]|uniref:uncharacterized protein LOC104814297 n=1 Tax=Tarenaya hassleriana TaxID=28532 RepID=UPI00053C5548|nr:PREDICTED: uncharacterized protein LOC104814297 [Tarenaya hassleriana]